MIKQKCHYFTITLYYSHSFEHSMSYPRSRVACIHKIPASCHRPTTHGAKWKSPRFASISKQLERQPPQSTTWSLTVPRGYQTWMTHMPNASIATKLKMTATAITPPPPFPPPFPPPAGEDAFSEGLGSSTQASASVRASRNPCSLLVTV